MKKLAIACVLSASLIFSSIVVPSSTALALEPTGNTVEKNITCGNIVTKDGYRVYVVNGYLIKIPASNAEPTQSELRNILQERGKISLVVKTIKTIYHKLPKQVKQFIKSHLGLNELIKFLEHWTGKIEDGIYNACKSAGMPDWMAWIVTEAIMMLI